MTYHRCIISFFIFANFPSKNITIKETIIKMEIDKLRTIFIFRLLKFVIKYVANDETNKIILIFR